MTAQHYIVETDWQDAPRVSKHGRRAADARNDPAAPQFDAAALTTVLSLEPKPVSNSAVRRVAATHAIPYDSLMARRRRAISEE